ncbi:MAG TPA: hypothetical protein VNN13_00940 [Methylomirabilota bacterium]|nr:hypothetical protein [Methylomirabilota bacterium]
MKLGTNGQKSMSYWQRIFSQSRVNGAQYNDGALPVFNWDWPKDTYLQRRRSRVELLAARGHAVGGHEREARA